MKLFTVGPVQMYDYTLDLASKQIPYFRTSEFSQIMFNIENNLKKVLSASEDSKTAILTASGTGAMEAAICSSFNSNERVLIINGGSFGRRFCELCSIHNIPFDEITLKNDEELTEEHFKSIDGSKYVALLVNIHETSTGQLYDIDLISKFAQENDLFLIVDAISSFLADYYSMEKNKIDCTIISSQKALSLEPGISIVVTSDRLYNKIRSEKPTSMYFNLNNYFVDMERGQTPYTPAVGIILQLNQRLEKIVEYGVNNIVNDTTKKAEYFRNLVQSNLPDIEIPSYKLSNALTPIWLKSQKAFDLFEHLKNNYEIYVTPSGGELKNKQLRIGHIGKLDNSDFDELIEIIKRWYNI